MTDATPKPDGSDHLFGDSKIGLALSYVLGVGLTFAAAEAAKVDLSSKRGWWVPFAALALSNAGGAWAAYKAKRAKARITRGN